MYINFWYPVALSKEVTNEKPLGVTIMDLNFVTFRDTEGNAHVLSNTCIHRGGNLSGGKVNGDCVACPYHGWEFDGEGKCQKLPTKPPEQKMPARAKVDAYPTEERYGIVFAFLGDLPEEERPPLYEIKSFDDENWRANDIVVFEVGAYYQRSIENGMDGAHNEFVHPLQGAPSIIGNLQRIPFDVKTESEWGCGFMYPATESTQGEKREIGAGEGGTLAGSSTHGPNTLITRIYFSEEKKFEQFFFEAPVSDDRTRIFFVNMRSFMMDPEMDQNLIDINMRIAHEDIDVIEKLDPVRTPETTSKELLTQVDKPIYAYREFLQKFDEKGWRIDWKAFQEQKGDVAFAIPSPARRTEKNWILDTIPLMDPPAKAETKLKDVG